MKFPFVIKPLSFILLSLPVLAADTLPPLPEPTANNGVVKVSTAKGDFLISFMGLGKGKEYPDVHNKVWALKFGDKNWQAKTPVPSSIKPIGRLASTAAAVNGKAYVFGGYTVDKNHHEISSPDVYRYDVLSNRYTLLAPMPVPVDDSVALVYQNRFIYLVSGWHNDGNVNLVQVYDTQTDSWQQASPFLGKSVFGQAGAIAGDTMLICDGVATVPFKDKRRGFEGVAQCFKGKITKDNPYKIDWRVVDHPTGIARYRMASAALDGNVYFVGGSDNPYNFNGIGYNGLPSTASKEIWRYQVDSGTWHIEQSTKATMDHRGLIIHEGKGLTIGGMNSEQQVLADVVIHDLLISEK